MFNWVAWWDGYSELVFQCRLPSSQKSGKLLTDFDWVKATSPKNSGATCTMELAGTILLGLTWRHIHWKKNQNSSTILHPNCIVVVLVHVYEKTGSPAVFIWRFSIIKFCP